MTNSSIERKIRAQLPFIRFFQSFIPLPLAHWLLKLGMSRVKLDPDVSHEPIRADGVPCEWIIPQGKPIDRVLLYLHGGGFVFGQTPQHMQVGAYLAQKMGTRILMVDYRTAPEFPFPAALEDCTTVYLWLLAQGFSSSHIAVAGDSAGGNLAITMMLKLREDHKPLPAGAAALSPVTDLSPRDENPGFKDPVLTPKTIKFYNQAYLQNSDPQNPLVSPVYGDLRGLPPILVHVGEEDRKSVV